VLQQLLKLFEELHEVNWQRVVKSFVAYSFSYETLGFGFGKLHSWERVVESLENSGFRHFALNNVAGGRFSAE
jgi:hypothetical protein